MKLIRRSYVPHGEGFVKLLPEIAEDLWQIYNLVSIGDHVSCSTARKVQKDTGKGESERIILKLEVEVESIDFDSVAMELRIRGKNIKENEFVKIGSYHTLEIELQRSFTLKKIYWDSISIDRLKESCDIAATADLGVILMQEGLANFCLIGGSITKMVAKIETSIPRKRGGGLYGYDKALDKFFENVFQSILRHFDFSIVRCLVIASPGFTKDQFFSFMNLESSRKNIREIIENKNKIILCHSSSAYKNSLKEILSSPSISNQIKDTKAAKEVKAIEEFFSMLSTDPSRAFYGFGHVQAANERFAIKTLLLTDTLFRNSDIKTRKQYVDLVESVKKNGGVVHIFSSLHVSGEQLDQMTGVAAILRLPMPDLEELEL